MIPFIDRISYVQVLKEIPMEIPRQTAITKGNEFFVKEMKIEKHFKINLDNVALNLDGVLYLKVFDPYLVSDR